MWNRFYYCEEDDCFYIFDGLKFSYVAAELPASQLEVKAFINHYAHAFNKDFSKNFEEAVKEASRLSIALHNQILQGTDPTLIIGSECMKTMQPFIDENHRTTPSLLTEDYLMGLVIRDLFDNKTPSSIWRGYATLQRREKTEVDIQTEKKISVWDGFYARTPNNIAVTVSKYIENILNNYGQELKDNLTHLKKKPKFISLKEGENAMNVLNKDKFHELRQTPVKKIEETTLWNYLATLSEQQRLYVGAWCFNTIVPRKIEPIHLVLWDKGGTGKTSLLAQTIRHFTKLLYDNDYFYIKGQDFNDTTARYDKLTDTDIADSIFCLMDDITTANLEDFSNATGSKNNTITCKKLYSNPYSKPNYTKYILATNYPLSIKRKEAFSRRIAIIHTYKSNTWKTSQSEEEFEKCFLADASTILDYWRQCYETVIKDYGSLVNAANTMSEIAPELENATDVEENLDEAVYELMQSIHSDESHKGEDPIKISNKEWKQKADSVLTDASYMKNVSLAQIRARLKQTEGIKINTSFRDPKTGRVVKGIAIVRSKEYEPTPQPEPEINFE